MKILIINGSHRKGNTDLAIAKIKTALEKKNIQVKTLVLRDIQMKLPDGCVACAEGEVCPNIKDEFSEKIEPAIRNYDIYVLATPTWSDGVTPLTKIFWDRIVSWVGEDRMYLKGKKLAIITHGMADKNSWQNAIDWVKSVCLWEECKFAGSLTFTSGGEVGNLKLTDKQVGLFVEKLLGETHDSSLN